MSQSEQSQAASVSDTTFAREMWRLSESSNMEAAKDVREHWKHCKGAEGYREHVGPVTAHEIGAIAKKCGLNASDNVIDFARAVERAALIKAYTLLPELRQAAEGQHYRRYFRDGLYWGLATYSNAIRVLAMGQTQDEIELETPAKPVKSRKSNALAKLELRPGVEAARSQFEAYAGKLQFDLTRKDGAYTNIVTSYVWLGWLAASAETSCTTRS
jgi:hypothetical protein